MRRYLSTILTTSPSRQLLLLQAATLCLLLLLLVALLWAGQTLHRQLHLADEQHAMQVLRSNDMLTRFSQLHSRLLQLVEEREAGHLDVIQSQHQLQTLLQTLDKLQAQALHGGDNGQLSTRSAVVADLQRYRELLLALPPLLGSNSEAAEAEVLLLNRRVQQKLAHFADLARQQNLEAQLRHDATVHDILGQHGQAAALLLLGVLLLLLLSAFKLRRLGQQLHATERALLQLGAGDTAIQLPAAQAAFRPLFAALQGFQDSLIARNAAQQALQQQQQLLEQQVQERTAHLQQLNQQLQDEVQQRRQAEHRRRLYETVFQHTDNAVIITTADARIVAANPAYLQMGGHELQALLGKRPPMLRDRRQGKNFYQQLWQQLRQHGRWQGEIVNRHVDGRLTHALLTINAVNTTDGRHGHYVGILSDISQLKAVEDRLKHMAYYDPLTSLPNRVLLKNRLEHEIEIAREEARQFAVVFIDLDRFKYVNDSLGHQAGDELLVEVAERLRGCVRSEDTVARLSGDEFCLVIRDCNPSQVAHVADSILRVLHLPFCIGNHDIDIGGSLGIAMYPADGSSPETLTKNADNAMYQAKALGRGQYCFFEPAIEARLKGEMDLFKQLRDAIETQQFSLHYQPVLALRPELQHYAEALLRWPQGGLLAMPGAAVPFAENHDLIDGIGEFVIADCCAFIADSRQPLTISINLSARQLEMPQLLTQLLRYTSEHGIPPTAIELELTESSLMQNLESGAAQLARLRQAGFRIAIDDFGTGYSSLGYLVELPVDKIKIDQRFVWGLFNSPRNQAVVQAVLQLAQAIGLQTVAEGVETAEQLAFLRQHGCDYVQGFLLARPMSGGDYLRYLQTPPAAV